VPGGTDEQGTEQQNEEDLRMKSVRRLGHTLFIVATSNAHIAA